MDIAIALLEEGRLGVTIDCEPTVAIRRNAQGPRAGGRILVSIYTFLSPPAITQTVADYDVSRGLRHLGAMVDADPRLQALIDQHCLTVEYLADYGMGAGLVGVVNDEGEITLVI